MDPSWTDVVTAVAASFAVVFSATAWAAALSALRTSYRPVVRVVPTYVFNDRTVGLSHLVLKNIGFGPALSVMLFESAAMHSEPLAGIEVIEVLGDAELEQDRRGRVEIAIASGLQVMRQYRLVYQDIAGGWHETRFTVRQQDFVTQLMGPARWWHPRKRRIPKAVRDRGNVVRAAEAI